MRPPSFGEFPARGIAPRIGLITDDRGNAMNTKRLNFLPLILAVLMLGACGGGDGTAAPPLEVRYFSAVSDGVNDFELWKTDGTEAGTVRVKDINLGPGGSDPFGFTVFNNALYFAANDGTSGHELWKTDGTEAGTVRVKDINPGAGGSAHFSSFGLTVFNNALYFLANDGTSGMEFWKTDGTEAGTVRVKDINLGPGDSDPFGFTVFNNALYF